MIRYSDSPRAEEEFYTTFEVKIDALENSVCWRSVLAPLPVWKRKIKKYAKRKANALVPMADKKWRVEETSKYLKENSPVRRVRLVSDPYEDENSRNMVCMSDLDNEGDPEAGLGLTPSVP